MGFSSPRTLRIAERATLQAAGRQSAAQNKDVARARL
jgi:hypothetical protein